MKLDGRSAAPTPGSVKVPGAGATTVHAGIWDLAFRVLLRARCGLSAYLHSILASRAAVEVAPEEQVWPMPLPFPEVHRRASGKKQRDASRKLGLNYIILILNWLSVGERLVGTDAIRLGARLNKKQWMVVKRLTPLVDGWNAQGSVDADAMGRSAAKVESIEEELHRLEEAVLEEQKSLRLYSKRVSRGYRGCREEEEDDLASYDLGQGHPGIAAGILEGGIQHVAKDIEPERLRFHEEPTFDPVSFLDYANRRAYLYPIDESKEVDMTDPLLPRVKVRCRAGGLLGVVEKLDQVGRLKLLPASRCRTGLENGLFAIPKDSSRDRMILDARRPNLCEASEGRWIYTMGTLQQLQHVFLQKDEDLYLHAEDLCEFYHAFIIGRQRQERNILKAYFKPSEVSHLRAYTEELAEEQFVGASLDTLAMGDTNAVAFGQTSHLSVLLRTGQFELEDFFGLKMRPSRKRWKAGLMIDDFLILEARKKDQEETEVRQKVEAVRKAYTEVGLPRHEGKAVEGELTGEFWGAQLQGREGILRPSLKRLIPLSNVILRVVALGRSTVGLLEVITGAAVSALQMRRRLLSILHELYVAQRGRPRNAIVVLSKQAKDELLCIVGLLAVAVMDMRLQASEYLLERSELAGANDTSTWERSEQVLEQRRSLEGSARTLTTSICKTLR